MASADLAEIWAYIAEDSLRQADILAVRIDQEFKVLARNPSIGRARPELLANLRSFPVDRYIIFYIPRPRGIEVIRVLHGARDLKPLFQQDVE